MKKVLRKITEGAALLSAGLSATRFVKATSPATAVLTPLKLVGGALSPVLALLGGASAAAGGWLDSPLSILLGTLGAGISLDYMRQVLAPHQGFTTAFGPDWRARIPPAARQRMLQRRWRPGLPKTPEPLWIRDFPFWRIPGTERDLLCDLWMPPASVPASGLAFTYFHGSGWHFLDKDVGTRPMFRHLTAQGHMVMDVAYRLCPETDWRGMVGDVKRAVAWLKLNGPDYRVDPDKIVVAGGSAGGHLALLGAYTPHYGELTPVDVIDALNEVDDREIDLSVGGVVAWYGPADVAAYHEHAGRIFSSLVDGGDTVASKLTAEMAGAMGFDLTPPDHWPAGVSVQEAMMCAIFGGTPDDKPAEIVAASPIHYVDTGRPPTLLLQGADDALVPPAATRRLAAELRAADVPVVHVEYPDTEHAFDLIFPKISPVARAALYEVEQFLALLAHTEVETG